MSKRRFSGVFECLEDRRLLAVLEAQYQVQLQTHSVAFGYDHLSLLITPEGSAFTDNDGDSRADQDCMFVKRSDGSFGLSLGAGPSGSVPGFLGNLVGDTNRDRDIAIHTADQLHALTRPAQYATSRQWVDALIRGTVGYPDSLTYKLFPDAGENEYNSNSFIAGLLSATGTSVADPSTIFADGDYPGYELPVPSASFPASTRARVDLIFVIDTTFSMEDDIDEAKASATQIVQSISSTALDYRVAIVDYRDFPEDPFGKAGDYPFHDVLPFSCSASRIIEGINSLELGNGGDLPESVYSGVMHAIDSESLGKWRGSTIEKHIILMGDAGPHDPEPNTGYTASSVAAAAEAGGIGTDGEGEVSQIANFDLSHDGYITAVDALRVINHLNNSTGVQALAETATELDVSGDGFVSAIDALLLINELNANEVSRLASAAFLRSNALSGEGSSDSIKIHTLVIGDDEDAVSSFSGLAAATGGSSFQANAADDFVDALLEAIGAVVGVVTTPPSGLVVATNASAVGDKSINEVVTLSGSLFDPDVTDTQNVTVNWGDGSGSQVIAVTRVGDSWQFSTTKTFNRAGRFHVVVTATDSSAQSISTTTTVFVSGVSLADGVLWIVGDNSHDVFNVFPLNASTTRASATINYRYLQLDLPQAQLQRIEAYGGSGNDFIHVDYNLAVPAMISGGDGIDTLFGGAADDEINGDGGNDFIYGFKGNDVLTGGSGVDRLFGGQGDDDLSGGADRDYIFGELGDDSLSGDAGDDFLFGAEGDDQLDGGTGEDFLYAGIDNDDLTGGDQNDWMFGEAGDDRFLGVETGDHTFGGPGNDIEV